MDLLSGLNTHPGRRVISFLLLYALIVLALSACTPLTLGEQVQIDTGLFSIHPEDENAPQETPSPQSQDGSAESGSAEAGEDEQILVIEEIIIGLLLVAALVGIGAKRVGLPYTVGLVIIGLALTLIGQVEIQISPNLILALLLPPLIFEAAFHLNISDLRQNLAPLLLLAVLGVILTTLIVGGIVAWGTGLSLSAALVFGALVSATDPVSVVALFRSMGVPKRLQILLEGESLLNDGTAIVIFDLVIVVALQGIGTFSLASTLGDFLRVAGGGLVVGFSLGMLASMVISRIDDYLIETTLTAVLAYGSYLIAEHLLGVSGVLAVVAAGLVNGNIGPHGMSPTTRIVVINFWEFAAFLANSFIFLLIGLRIDLNDLFQAWYLVVWAVAAVLIARAISVYGITAMTGDIPHKWKHVLFWGGLRGAISLALALSLPSALKETGQLQFMAFGVVLFTLLVQGFSMARLVRRLGLVERSEMQDEYERRHARAVANRASYEHLERRYRQGLLSDHTWKSLSPYLSEHNRRLVEAVKEVMTSDPSVEAEELDTARREALRAQRSAITALRRDRVISDDNYAILVSEVDAALTEASVGWPELLGSRDANRGNIDRLMAIVIQYDDLENAFSALTKLGFSLTRLPSSGGFLRRRNTTLLVGLEHGHERAAVHALETSCRQRVIYLSTPLEGMPVSAAEPIPVTIGGATIFTFEIERYEAF